MKQRTQVALLATLVSATGWSQEVSLYGTTMAQMWKEGTPGFEKSTYLPATQFLGIDAVNLGRENLSLHLFGWGRGDLGDKSMAATDPKGYLAYGYLNYRFKQANAEIKAGRFTTSQGVGIEQVDGVQIRADLEHGFTVSGFGGKPVWYRTAQEKDRNDYEFQHDFIFGARIAHRSRLGEFGVSFLQDGSKAAKDLDIPSPVDYTRKQLGGDIHISLYPNWDLTGRTILDVAGHPGTPAGQIRPSKIAENDYTLTLKGSSKVSFAALYTERNAQAYFAGTNLPTLFNPRERDKFQSYGARLNVMASAAFQLSGDYRHFNREVYGDADKYGINLRWTPADSKFRGGLGYARVDANDVKTLSATLPFYTLSHYELRAWAMVEKGKLSASLDGISHWYDDKNNPQLNGRTNVFEVVASLGYQTSEHLKVSADVSYGANAYFKNETRALLRAEFRFAKGGSK